MNRIQNFFNELKKRNVYKVGIAYGITGWVIIQMGAVATNSFGAPPWVMKTIIILILLGLPVALIFAWAFELTTDGIKRTNEIYEAESITHHTEKKLNFWIIGTLSLAVVLLLVVNFWFGGFSSNINKALAKDPEPSIAVLPFEDFSRSGENEWFSDGITEAILNSLARHPDFKVAARTSSFYFKNKNVPIQQIADTLDVNYIVEGSVRLADSTMRITAQLIRASNGYHLWSKTYSRKMEDVFQIQKDIAKNIAAALDVYLDEDAREKMFNFGTRNVLAYKAYMKGKNIYDKLHRSRRIFTSMILFNKANPWFKKAIEYDPGFSAPYYAHSDSYLHYILNYSEFNVDSLSVEEAHRILLNNFDKAIANAENPGMQLMYKLEKTYLTDNWSRIPQLVKKLKNSKDAQRAFTMLDGGWTRSLLAKLGYARLQYQLSKQALKLDPFYAGFRGSKLIGRLFMVSPDSALIVYNEYIKKNNISEGNFIARYFLTMYNGQIDRADSLMMSTGSSVTHPYNVLIQAVRGEKKKARKNWQKFANEQFKNSFNSAFIHYAVGNHKKANSLAIAFDTTALGPLKLLTKTDTFTFFGYDISAMPTLSARLNEARVDIGKVKIGKVYFPTIIQREIE